MLPREKSFPPYVWIHIKDFLLQEYWIKKYNEVMKEMPKYKTYIYPQNSTKSGKPLIIYTSATIKPQFIKTFHINSFVRHTIITWMVLPLHHRRAAEAEQEAAVATEVFGRPGAHRLLLQAEGLRDVQQHRSSDTKHHDKN